MIREPVVSILMASYNHSEFIGQAIESVLEQDYAAWELIICDDGSTDRTREVVEQYRDPRIQAHFFPVNRQYHMRNVALSKARGEYIGILNSDDIYLPGKLKKQISYLQSHLETVAVFTLAKAVNKDSEDLPGHPIEKYSGKNRSRHQWLRQFLFHGNSVCLSSVMIRNAAMQSVEPFDPLLIQASDFDLWIQLCLKGEMYILQEILTGLRFFKNNKSLSSSTVDTGNRLLLEKNRLYQRYLSNEALEQFDSIFPELAEVLPHTSKDWKIYLICQMASSMKMYHARIFGFQGLQKLLGDPEKRRTLQEKHPRLMKNFFFSAGNGALSPGIKTTGWILSWGKNSSLLKSDFCFWKNQMGPGKVVFSIPLPPEKSPLGLRPAKKGVKIYFSRISIFNQQTGKLIWQFSKDSSSTELETDKSLCLKKTSTGWILKFSRTRIGFLLLPVENSCCGQWLDVEIDLTKPISCNPFRQGFFYELISDLAYDLKSKTVYDALSLAKSTINRVFSPKTDKRGPESTH